jgi:hypothetical protein
MEPLAILQRQGEILLHNPTNFANWALGYSSDEGSNCTVTDSHGEIVSSGQR